MVITPRAFVRLVRQLADAATRGRGKRAKS
jgi:hypothetical protein